MKKFVEILTPENVTIEHELAGLGSRFSAMCIDLLVQILLMLLVLLGMLASGLNFEIDSLNSITSFVVAVGLALIFVVFFGYHIFFEIIMNGQTPGKKVLNIRVIKQTGESIGFFESVLRNVLRIADFLPYLNLLGAAFIIMTKEYKRIGDYAANTIVVKSHGGVIKTSVLDDIYKQIVITEDEAQVNEYPINNKEYGVLKEYLSRRDNLGERKPAFAYHLNKYFMKKFNIDAPKYEEPDEFFYDIIRMNLNR